MGNLCSSQTPEVKLDSKVVKILILGGAGVGKTSLINRIVSNTFDLQTQATLCLQYYYYFKKGIKIQFIDTPGVKKFQCCVPNRIINGCDAIIYVASENSNSLEDIWKWDQRVTTLNKNCPKYLVVNQWKNATKDRGFEENLEQLHIKFKQTFYTNSSIEMSEEFNQIVNSAIEGLERNEHYQQSNTYTECKLTDNQAAQEYYPINIEYMD